MGRGPVKVDDVDVYRDCTQSIWEVWLLVLWGKLLAVVSILTMETRIM